MPSFQKKAREIRRQMIQKQVGDFCNYRAGSVITVSFGNRLEEKILKHVARKPNGRYYIVYDEPSIFNKDKILESYIAFKDIECIKNNIEGKIVVKKDKDCKFNDPVFFPKGTKVKFSSLIGCGGKVLTVNKLFENDVYSYCISTVETHEDKCFAIYKEGVSYIEATADDIIGYEIKPHMVNISHVVEIISRGDNDVVFEKFESDSYYSNASYDPEVGIVKILRRYNIDITNIDFQRFVRHLVNTDVIRIKSKQNFETVLFSNEFIYTKGFKKAVLQNQNRFRIKKAVIVERNELANEELYADMHF